MAVNWSRNFWNAQKTQICHQRKAAKKKFATTPDNGLELNVKCFWNDGCEHLFLHCSSGFPRLGGRESFASLQFWLSTDWSIINKDWNSNGQDWEIRMNTHNSTGLRIPTDWISCAKPSSARPSHTLYPCPLLPLLPYVPHFLATISVVLILRLQLLWV